jgi:two-component system chemotaxis sensor kinase CheA
VNKGSGETAAELSAALEQITLDLLVGEAGEDTVVRCTKSLVSLAERARGSHRLHAAQLAERLVERLSSDPAAWEDIDGELQQLRDAFETADAPTSEQHPAAQPVIPISQDPELLNDFIVEAREHLESIEARLLEVEQDAANLEAIHSIFRSFHTIKGLAGFLELPLIKSVAHEVETVLDQARDSRLTITAHAIDVILESKDYVGRWLKFLENGPVAEAPAELSSIDALLGRVHSLMGAAPEEPESAELSAGQVETTAEPSMAEAEPDIPASPPKQEPAAAATLNATRAAAKTANGRSVKVDTDKLDYLVDMVGEMVIAQSLVRHDPDLATVSNERLERSLAQLARITDEVQRTAMAMRMVPIGPLFQKMARLVRDLSRKFGKQIQFEAVGEDVELDRNIVEELADPLMHMVRNAVDHGIETAEQRAAAGKSKTASVVLRAYHRSAQIVIEVADDGRGINRQRILNKAIASGVVASNTPLSDSEILDLIFHPGLSTAEKLSDVSGRGVGMDVVRKQIQKLRGSVDIHSVEGQGTTFALRLPLTLAIIEGLVVTSGAERYIIPLASVKELLRPTAGMISSVENRAEVVSIRDSLYPLVRLYERFRVRPRTTDPTDAVLVVVDHDGISFCMMVDELVGKQEVVIKSLGPVFRKVSGVAGGAILGDGHVGLILDMQGVFNGASREA